MTFDEQHLIAKSIMDDAYKVLESKGKDYAGLGDSLANFKRNAERQGLTKYQIWNVYFNKQFDAINNAIKANPSNPQVESEPIRSRVIDIINYLILLVALMEEK